MKILIVGGTLFLGRHLVDAAAARGHDVTTFSRGCHNLEPRRDVESLRGDRQQWWQSACAGDAGTGVCRTVSASDTRFAWTDERYLLDRGVQQRNELPLWMPRADNGIVEMRDDSAIAEE